MTTTSIQKRAPKEATIPWPGTFGCGVDRVTLPRSLTVGPAVRGYALLPHRCAEVFARAALTEQFEPLGTILATQPVLSANHPAGETWGFEKWPRQSGTSRSWN